MINVSIMIKVNNRLAIFLITLFSMHSFYLQGARLVNTPLLYSEESEAIDSLNLENSELAEIVELNRLKRDSVVEARSKNQAVQSLALPQIASFGATTFGPSIMSFSTSDLLMHLKLDTDGVDASGNGNSGTPGGDYSFVTEGHLNGSIHANGITNGLTGTAGGHVSLPDLGLNNLTEFTVSIWVKDEKAIPDEGLIWFGDWHTGWGGIAHLWGNTRFHVGGIGTSGGGILLPYESDDLGVWVMYTLVYNNGVMKAYKNGQYRDQIAVNVYIPKGQFCGLGQHWWGGNGEGTSTRYTGKIDEARVYSKALTDTDVLDLYGFTDPDQEPGSNSVAVSSDKNYVLEYTSRVEGIDENTNIAGLAISSR
ncbi:MAG: LamG domain-containing protein, partial [Cyclobacteriaceae bacterium]|nr:LamG domain-containing protein [Cyclobacteriaceae bacterium]